MGKFIDLTGQKFERLLVVKQNGRTKHGLILWECLCECKNISYVTGYDLKSGHTKSCGCLNNEKIAHINKTHGESRTRLYGIWSGLHSRCNNAKTKWFKNYGSRGISVSEEWDDFIVFKNWALLNGYTDNLSIERIDNNDDYSPNNCKWATRIEQQNNTRKNIYITYDGETKTIAQWSNALGIDYQALYYRINSNWSVEKAFRTPSRKKSNTTKIA